MFRMRARNCHTYTHLMLCPGIVREPTVRGVYDFKILLHTYDIGRATSLPAPHQGFVAKFLHSRLPARVPPPASVWPRQCHMVRWTQVSRHSLRMTAANVMCAGAF